MLEFERGSTRLHFPDNSFLEVAMDMSQDERSNECISFQIRPFAVKNWLRVDLLLSNVCI